MFNRKKIKALKENLKTVNDQRLQLRNENLIYQKELNALKQMVNDFKEVLTTNNELIKDGLNELLKQKYTRKTPKVKKEVKKDEQ